MIISRLTDGERFTLLFWLKIKSNKALPFWTCFEDFAFVSPLPSSMGTSKVGKIQIWRENDVVSSASGSANLAAPRLRDLGPFSMGFIWLCMLQYANPRTSIWPYGTWMRCPINVMTVIVTRKGRWGGPCEPFDSCGEPLVNQIDPKSNV